MAKAKRIKPISFGIKGDAVKANTHGEWGYNKDTKTLRVKVAVFSEDDETLHIFPEIILNADITDSWTDDAQIIGAAFAHLGIEVDTDYKEPQEPTHEEVAI